MGFKRENYTLKGLCVCIYFLLTTSAIPIYGQPHCPIRVDYEPREVTQTRSANNIEEIKFPFFQQWQNLGNLRLSDEQKASVTLPSTKRSTVFKGKNLGFSLPNGAHISGIELIVEGHTQGEGFVEEQMVRLLNGNGEASGSNEVNNALPTDEVWKKSDDGTDFTWRYGSPTNTWGLQLTDELINDKDFGYAIQVRNKLNEPVSVSIDHVQMIVYYTPLYEICSTHACVPFYIDKSEDPLVTYEWYIPQGFELISDSEEDPAINIGVSYAGFGEYEICVESFYKQSSLGTCCRKFNYKNCEPAQISGQVFFDENNDSSNNNDDFGIEDILVNLYSNQGLFVASTLTDEDGEYSFLNLDPGQFYIEVVEEIDSLLFTQPNIGPDSQDSDITGAFGEGTTDLISLASGDSLTSIDAGLNLALTIGDFVWEDLDGDGVQQATEPGIEGIKVHLTSSNNTSYSVKTDANGQYSFSGLPAGDYILDFEMSDLYIATKPNNSGDNTDSDFIPNESIFLSFSQGGVIDSIDAGYFRPCTIGNFVWEDENSDGLQDDDEPGIEGATLNLIDENNDIIQTVMSDSQGFYEFTNLAPGKYYIEIQTGILYSPTLYQKGGGAFKETDSDVLLQDGKFVTTQFVITSNTTDSSIDLGFVEKPALVAGFTFLDQNNNGQYDSDETFVPDVNIKLFNSNDVQIGSTQSDVGGFYLFENIPPSSYYLVFELKDEYLFTLSNTGDDLSDSDVISTITLGSTDLFNLLPDEENYSISAGYQAKPKVGDYVWLDENGNGLQDDENGINDVVVELYNDLDELVQSTISGPHPDNTGSGFYQFTTLDPGNYYIKIPTNELYDFAIIDESQVGSNSTISNENGIGTSHIFSLIGNQCNNDIDAGYAFKKGNIRGEVWVDSDEDGIQDMDDDTKSGVFVELYNELGERLFFRTTNEDGEYFFNGLDAGNYYVVFTPTDRYRFTNSLSSVDTSLDSDVTGDNGDGSTPLLAVMDGLTIEHIDAGLIDGAITIEGLTWIDDNGDGIQQLTEHPLADVRVELFNLSDSLLASEITNAEGIYQFNKNLSGQYYIVFTPEDISYINTLADQGADDSLDDDVTSFFTMGSTDTIDAIFFQNEEFVNAGYYQMSSIGDQVFIDVNENGINDTEPGLDGVIVDLLNDSGSVVTSDITAQGGGLDSGYYLLENIPPGTYTVQFTRPLFYQFVAADQGSDDNIDSDVAEISNNTGTTKEIVVTSGSTNLTIDAGLFFQIPTESSITGVIWDDTNTNGIRDNDEMPIPAIPMTLENQNGEVIDMTVSNEEGIYLFDNLAEGFYVVKATVLLDKVATSPNVGMDESIDSDFIEMADELATEAFFLGTFEDLENVDLGLVNKLRIGDYVWEDLNNNGVQDANEIGIEEIEITITSQNGIISETVMSDVEGAYQFVDLPAGHYQVCVDLPSGFNFAKSNIGTDILDSDIDSSGCTEFIDFTAGGTINDLDIGLTKNGSVIGIAFIDLNGNGVINLTDPGLDGVIVNLHSESGELLNTTVTSTVDDIPGIFEFKNLKATDYYLVFEYPEEYIITNPNVGDDLTDSDITGAFGEGSTDIFSIPSGGIVNTVNGGAYLPASIGDQVWLDENEDGIQDENEGGVANIEVIIFRSFGIPFDTTITDEEGYYQFENLKQGLYFIQFVIPQEFAISPTDQGTDDAVDSDADNTGKTPLISLAHGADLESVDCGIFSSMASLRSVVWNDSDGDGMRQSQEARIPGIRISLLDDDDNLIESTETNSLGLYAFQHIPEGGYKIYVNLDDTDYAITSMNMNDDDYHDSDIKPTGESEIFISDEIESTLSVPNVDAGLYESGGINSIAWEDTNADGIYDLEENTFSDVVANLYTVGGTFVKKHTVENENNSISFNNIAPGKYFIRYEVGEEYVASPLNGDVLVDNNSDITKFEGHYVTPVFQVLSNEVVSHIDAGFYKGSALNSRIWFDTNKNGIQDEQGEIPSGIYATIYNSDGKSVGTRGINQEGQIRFVGIPKGSYYLKYYSSANLHFTKTAGDTDINSDVDHSNGVGTTRLFDFNPYETYSDIDAGLLKPQDIIQGLEAQMTALETNEIRDFDQNVEGKIHFEVYPNPAANYLKINIDDSEIGGIISIRNNQNQLVYSGNAIDIDKINLSEFHPGIYYVKYENRGRSMTKKILKIQ